jgi:hypothetical protein
MLPTAAAAPAILLMASPQRYQEYGAATTFSPLALRNRRNLQALTCGFALKFLIY